MSVSVCEFGESTLKDRVKPPEVEPFTLIAIERRPISIVYERAYTDSVSFTLPSACSVAVHAVWVFRPTPVAESNAPEPITVPLGASGVGAGAGVAVAAGVSVGTASVGCGVAVGMTN